MQSLLEANPDQYDLLIVTDYMVDILRQNGLLEALDKSKLPNYGNINPCIWATTTIPRASTPFLCHFHLAAFGQP